MKIKRLLVLLAFLLTGFLVGLMLQSNPHYYDQACWEGVK